MTEDQWGRLRPESARAVRILADLIAEPGAEPERLLRAYLDAKARLAEAFRALALERLSDPTDDYVAAIADLDRQLVQSYSGVLPEKYLRVRGYGGVHPQLFAYLSRRVGQVVSALELRVLTGDAVHTERRVRELRDLGFEILAAHSAGSDTYRLTSKRPDLHKGALQIARLNIKSDRTLSASEQAALLQTIGADES
jgi:hypothetical protein